MAKQSKPSLAGAPVITDEIRKISELTADPRNTRRHSEAQISQIVQSIDHFGFVEKIAIRSDGRVIDGHARLEALKRRQADPEQAGTVEVRVVDGLSESAYKALGLALNRIPENSQWDDDILRDILGEIQNEGEDLIGLGFSPNELNKRLGRSVLVSPVDRFHNYRIRRLEACQAVDVLEKVIDNLGIEDGTCLPLPDMPPPLTPNDAHKAEMKNAVANLLRTILLWNDGNVSASRLRRF
jgi:ParB-like nuclease domain